MDSVESRLENGLLTVSCTERRRRSDLCWRWVSICSFLLVVGAAVFFALLHFKIIPTPANKDEFRMPEILAVRTYLDSIPTDVRKHNKLGKKLAAHCPGYVENGQLVWKESTLMDEDIDSKEGQVKLQDNSLVIPKDGLYFVYTQVAFTGRNCQVTKPLYLSHIVNKWSLSYDDHSPILTSTKSVCEVKSSSAWFQPMYQGGLFYLEEGDILSTSTDGIGQLDVSDTQIYFGVLAI
ncbi:tumor necrosis factor [Bombina bombina]|uniref:tumor necrosis factor n=1 Tax=Bombina bombina TaxID=8345 RepID=UPI00235A681C|nr:tumor necrosis factor [Bombina bombina]